MNASPEKYDPIARLLHWLVLVLLIVQFGIAWTMPEIGRDSKPEGLIAWHLSVGTLILLVIVLRIVWRLTHAVPPSPTTIPAWQRSL